MNKSKILESLKEKAGTVTISKLKKAKFLVSLKE